MMLERHAYATPFCMLPTYKYATNDLPPPNLGKESLAPDEMYIER